VLTPILTPVVGVGVEAEEAEAEEVLLEAGKDKARW
jgi:hypothetical protein